MRQTGHSSRRQMYALWRCVGRRHRRPVKDLSCTHTLRPACSTGTLSAARPSVPGSNGGMVACPRPQHSLPTPHKKGRASIIKLLLPRRPCPPLSMPHSARRTLIHLPSTRPHHWSIKAAAVVRIAFSSLRPTPHHTDTMLFSSLALILSLAGACAAPAPADATSTSAAPSSTSDSWVPPVNNKTAPAVTLPLANPPVFDKPNEDNWRESLPGTSFADPYGSDSRHTGLDHLSGHGHHHLLVVGQGPCQRFSRRGGADPHKRQQVAPGGRRSS